MFVPQIHMLNPNVESGFFDIITSYTAHRNGIISFIKKSFRELDVQQEYTFSESESRSSPDMESASIYIV